MKSCDNNLVQNIQRGQVLPKAVFAGLYYVNDSIQNVTKPEPVDEPAVQCNGRLGFSHIVMTDEYSSSCKLN